MSILSARKLRKAYGPKTLLDGASITVSDRERVGLVGANGTGKSTLLKILAGLEPTDEGIVERRRGASIQYLAQEPELDAAATPRQIVVAGLDPTQYEHTAHEMLSRFGVRDLDRAVGTMSGGERRRVALAQLLVSQPALAILDEPTNHLDADTIEWLESYLADAYPGAILLVTHDRYVLDAVVERVFELDGGELFEYDGGYSSYLERKAERLEHAERTEQNRLNLLRRERAWLARAPQARSTKQKARIGRAEALIKAEPNRPGRVLSLSGLEQSASRLGRTIVDLEGVRLDIAGRTLVRDLTLHMVEGDRIGILGPNGIGKTSLLRLVAGELAATSGTVVRGQRTAFVYFDQARTSLRDDWTIFDNVAEREGAERTGGGVVTVGKQTLPLRTYLEQFLFEPSQQRQKVGALSGGERARVALALALKSTANLLLLDEPTNDLDVDTLGALEELLISWPGCALVVSHDRYFLDRIATSVLAFESDGRVVHYAGGYSASRAARDAAAAETAADDDDDTRRSTQRARQAGPPSPSSPTPKEPTTSVALKPLTYAERIELGGLLDRIDVAEGRKTAADATLADPSLYTRPADEIRRANDERESAHAEVERLVTRWADLERRREASTKS